MITIETHLVSTSSFVYSFHGVRVFFSNMSDSSCDSDIEIAANAALDTLLPEKSRKKYEREYTLFRDWSATKHIKTISEKVMMAYFSGKSKKEKPSSLWSHYSMLKSTILLNDNVDISKFTQLIAFLKRKSEGYMSKKSKIFSKDDIHKFLIEADNEIYLMMKVTLIVGVFGACRREELKNLELSDIEDKNTYIIINIPNTKTLISRQFVITQGSVKEFNCLETFRQYFRLRPENVKHDRFFLSYKNGKCSSQPVGINTFGNIPKKIAMYLGLKNSETFTGHCFRRSSASLLADAGADMNVLKRHGGWKSNSVAEGYVETSVQNKKEIAMKIMGENISNVESTNISNANMNCTASTSSGITVSNCSKFVINVYNK